MRKKQIAELNRLSPEDAQKRERWPLIIICDNIRSALNIGSVFRTADAFAVEAVFLCGICAQPPHRDIQKTALGAWDSVPWKYFLSVEMAIVEALKKGYQVTVLEQTHQSESLEDTQMGDNLALVLGHEVNGVSEAALSQAQSAIEIPQFGAKHSFNVSVSLGIALWALSRQSSFFKK